MKMLHDFARYAGRQPDRRIMGFAFVVFVLVLVAGCGNSNSTQPATPPPSSPTNAAPTSSVAPAPTTQPVATSNPGSTQPDMQALNRALMHWMFKNHRHPQNFQDFASTADVQIPNPPAGKKYALNTRGFIVLVDNTTQ